VHLIDLLIFNITIMHYVHSFKTLLVPGYIHQPPQWCNISCSAVHLYWLFSSNLHYGLEWGSFPIRATIFSPCHHIQIGSRAHPASYPRGTGCSFPRGKAAGVQNWPLTSIQCCG